MWVFLVNIATSIIGIITNPTVKLAVQGVTTIMAAVPDGFCQDVLAAVLSANANADLVDNKAKYVWVYNTIRNKYAGIGENTLRAAIEVYVGSAKKGLV